MSQIIVTDFKTALNRCLFELHQSYFAETALRWNVRLEVLRALESFSVAFWRSSPSPRCRCCSIIRSSIVRAVEILQSLLHSERKLCFQSLVALYQA